MNAKLVKNFLSCVITQNFQTELIGVTWHDFKRYCIQNFVLGPPC